MTAAELVDHPASTAAPSVEPGPRRPHLVAVPDCEPPLEPLPADPDNVATAHTRQISFAPGPDRGPSLLLMDRERAATTPRAQRPEPWATAAIAYRRCAPAGPLPGSVADPRRTRRAAVGPRRHPFLVTARDVPDWSTDGQVGVQHTSSATLPPALDAGTALVRGLLEALSGQRTVAQLRTHCAPDVFAGLVRLGTLLAPKIQLLSIWTCQPADGVAELSAAFRWGTRTRALAIRLEGIDGRWRITVMHLG